MAVAENGLWNGAFSVVLKKGRQDVEKTLKRWGPGLTHGFINTGWQKRSQVPDNEEGVAIFFKAIWWQGKQKWHSADEWAEFDLAFWPLTINLTCYFIKNYSSATHIWLWIFTIPFTFFFFFEYMVQEDKCLCCIQQRGGNMGSSEEEKKLRKRGESNKTNSHKMVYTCNSELSGIFFMGLTKIATGNNWWPHTPGLEETPRRVGWAPSPPASPARLCSPPPPAPKGIKWILMNPSPMVCAGKDFGANHYRKERTLGPGHRAVFIVDQGHPCKH